MKSRRPRHGSVESEKLKLLSHRPQSNMEVSLLSAAQTPSPRDCNWWPGRSRGESIRRDELDLEKWHWVLHLYCSWQIGRVRLQVFPSQSIRTDKKTKAEAELQFIITGDKEGRGRKLTSLNGVISSQRLKKQGAKPMMSPRTVEQQRPWGTTSDNAGCQRKTGFSAGVQSPLKAAIINIWSQT